MVGELILGVLKLGLDHVFTTPWILLLAVVFFGLAIVKSNDLRRLRTEKVSKQLEKIERRLDSLERKLSTFPTLSNTDSVNSSSMKKTDGGEAKLAEIANLKYFDPNANFGGRKIIAIKLFCAKAKLVNDIHEIERALGDGIKRVYDSEKAVLSKLRRTRNRENGNGTAY
jgi:hypothetical protein